MNMRKLSINKACVLLGTLLLLAVGAVCTAVHLLTQNITAVRCVFLFSLFVLLCVICFVALIRRKLVRFSDAFCGQMDDMLSENMQPKQTVEEENLFYKINYRLGRLYEVMQENKNSIAKERADLQELISDISHQVKTPIANLKMINNTLLENEVPPQKQKEFLTAQASQLDKLDFLMQAMIKTSRLETGVISLEQKQQPVYDTLAAALGGILLNAEKKQIEQNSTKMPNNSTYQTAVISWINAYKATETVTIAASRRTAKKIQALLTESFRTFISAPLRSTYSPYHIPF